MAALDIEHPVWVATDKLLDSLAKIRLISDKTNDDISADLVDQLVRTHYETKIFVSD